MPTANPSGTGATTGCRTVVGMMTARTMPRAGRMAAGVLPKADLRMLDEKEPAAKEST